MIFNYQKPGFSGLGWSPELSSILFVPKPGSFYQTKKGDTVWSISKRAYGRASVKKGLLLINKSEWNDHVKKGKKGGKYWKTYGVRGLQLTAHYDPAVPDSEYGSGRAFPVLWIPELNGAEPDEPPATPPPRECPPPRIIEKVVEKRVEVPGPERIVEKRVEVPGPPRIVEKVVEKRVEVPGPERIVEKRVEVPGPERIVQGPPRIVEKVVEVPGPERIIEKRVEVPTGDPQPRKEWTDGQSFLFWSAVLTSIGRHS